MYVKEIRQALQKKLANERHKFIVKVETDEIEIIEEKNRQAGQLQKVRIKTIPYEEYIIWRINLEHEVQGLSRIEYNLRGTTLFQCLWRSSKPRVTGVISIFVDRLLKNKPIVIYGEQTRDFINIKDVVSANILSMNANQQGAEVIQHSNTV